MGSLPARVPRQQRPGYPPGRERGHLSKDGTCAAAGGGRGAGQRHCGGGTGRRLGAASAGDREPPAPAPRSGRELAGVGPAAPRPGRSEAGDGAEPGPAAGAPLQRPPLPVSGSGLGEAPGPTPPGCPAARAGDGAPRAKRLPAPGRRGGGRLAEP